MKKNLIVAVFITVLYSCSGNQPSTENNEESPPKAADEFVAKQKERQEKLGENKKVVAEQVKGATDVKSFLDKIEQLDRNLLTDIASYMSDSIFYGQQTLNKTFSRKEFKQLKKAIQRKEMDKETIQSLFGTIKIDEKSIVNGKIPIQHFGFSQEDHFEEFAVCFSKEGYGRDYDVYFFKQNHLLSKHYIYHHYGLELNSFKDKDEKTVVYYKYQYTSGSGIWWNNYYFYKYDGATLCPALNLLANSNLQFPWAPLSMWFKTDIVSTDPLQAKMEYSFALMNDKNSYDIVEGRSNPEYKWDGEQKKFVSNYTDRETKDLMSSFYLYDSNLLFIHEHINEFRNALKKKQSADLAKTYLNDIKKQWEGKK